LYTIGRLDTRNNPDMYKGEPIWNTAERQGLISHVYGWVGVDAPIGGHFPTRAVAYDVARTRQQIADMVLEALCQEDVEQIPNLIMWYFDQPDMIEHYYSTESEETREVVEEIDSVLRYFLTEVRNSPVYDKIDFIFTADHGHTPLSPERYINLYPLIGEMVERCDNATPLGIKPKEGYMDAVMDTLAAHAEHYRVWKREDIPQEYHYGTYTARILPIILQPDLGYKIVCHQEPYYRLPLEGSSAHGYDPDESDMQMVFYAFGPHFKRAYRHDKTFCDINDYLIMCRLLDIEPAPNDGDMQEVEEMFR